MKQSLLWRDDRLGRVDDEGFTGDLKEKTGAQSLAAGRSRRHSYRMEFHAC